MRAKGKSEIDMTDKRKASGPTLELSGDLPEKIKVPRPFKVAIVGATGAVGRETLSILHERKFPIERIRVFASPRSMGEKLPFGDEELVVEELGDGAFVDTELVFMSAGGKQSKALCPKAAEAGAVCIDKSSVFRMDADVPLVVPEVNGGALANWEARRIIANPNCSTIQLVQVLAPLHRLAGLKRVVVSTYQAVSGAGRAGVDELDHQVRDLFNFRDLRSTEVFGQRIAFNALPMIPKGGVLDDGSTEEERKMVVETRKILGLSDLRVGVTCVRVPVFTGHSEAVHLELERKITPDEAREALRSAPNVLVVDEPEKGIYPTAVDAAGQDFTLVGRIREDPSGDNGLALWIVSDNLRTGAALNAVRIAERLCAEYLA